METTETTKMTCDDFIAALKRKDFTPDDLRNIARWAKQEEKRLAKNGIAGARVGDTLIISSRMGETARVTLDKVNQTKAEITLIDAFEKFEAGALVTCPISSLSRPTE
tara:strand:- start:254 stop:577 length:324 start_codon:yes stop_codon:yes gene_type:complete